MSYPLGSCTWVPADSYNYIDIYNSAQTNANRGETPGRVLESGKLLKQKNLLLEGTKLKKKKRRTNKYDELSLQYQYAQKWLSKRNSQVSVKLTRTELKVFIKWFDSRMSLFQKADGIDVDKVGEEFVKHKIFQNQAEALSFLDKVDSDGNGALSYDEFCEGIESVSDYLQVMLLKKFIHSLQVKEYKNRLKFKDSQKFNKSEHLLKKEKVVAPVAVVPKKVVSGDIALAATITKVTIPGGGVMYTHTPARKKVEVSAGSSFPSPKKVNAINNSTAKKQGSAKDIGKLSRKNSEKGKSFPQMGGSSTPDPTGNKNSIRKISVFIAPGNDAILHQNALFQQGLQSQQQPLPPCEKSLPSSPRDTGDVKANKTSQEDLLQISKTMQSKLEHFMLERQMSFEERENNKKEPEATLDDVSLVLEDLDIHNDPSNKPLSDSGNQRRRSGDGGRNNRPILAWADSCGGTPPSSPKNESRFRNKLVTAIMRNNNVGS